jgi:hypothetical protein
MTCRVSSKEREERADGRQLACIPAISILYYPLMVHWTVH